MSPQQAVQSQNVCITDKRDGVRRLVLVVDVHRYLYKEPPTRLEVLGQKVVEHEHVLLLGELDVVGNVLEYLAHEHQPSLDSRGRLGLDYPGLVRRDYCRVDEPEKDDRSHRANVLLGVWEPLGQDLEVFIKNEVH